MTNDMTEVGLAHRIVNAARLFAVTALLLVVERAEAGEEAPRVPIPSLARVVELAKSRAPQVIAAGGQVGVARAGYEGAKLGVVQNPYVEIYGDREAAAATDVALQATLWVPLELSGQRARRIAEVDAWVKWASSSLEGTRALAVGAAVAAYGDVVVGAERVRAFELIVDTARQEAEFYEARLAAGDASLQDAKFAAVELGRNSVSLSESRADLSRALATLAQQTGAEGYAPPAGLELEPPGRDQPPPAAKDKAERAPAVTAMAREAEYFARAGERQAREAHAPLSVIVGGGRGTLGEARVGAGLAWTFPLLRKNQGEVARAEAERGRAVASRAAVARALATTLEARHEELRALRGGIAEVVTHAEPAARAAVDAALAMVRAGKMDLLRVLLARRDYASLVSRKLDLIRREWNIVGEIAAITGELP
jgi:outer membrane protein, heavy metal efflux system